MSAETIRNEIEREKRFLVCQSSNTRAWTDSLAKLRGLYAKLDKAERHVPALLRRQAT